MDNLGMAVTFATLGQKTTVMSPEVFIGAGIPCCRLVQNIGEFVVTFPGAYHSGFSHGFNCGEASNIATPGWLRFAKEAAIRRACINYPPMLSHLQLLYELALTLSTRVPMSIRSGPRSSRLKEKKRREGETIVKELFVKNEIQNNELLFVLLEQGISCVVLPQNSSEIFLSSSNSRVGSERKVKPRLSLGLCSNKEPPEVPRVNTGPRNLSDLCSVKGRSSSVLSSQFSQSEYHDSCISTSIISEMNYVKESSSQRNGLLDQGLISCVTCGILSFACAAIVQPKEVAAQYLMSSDCIFFNDSEDGSESPDRCGANEIEYNSGMNGYSGNFRGQLDSDTNGLYDVPIKSGQYQVQVADQRVAVTDTETQKVQKAMSSLDLLASTYGNSSDSDEEHSDEEQVETEFHHKNDFRTCSPMSDCSLETAMRMERIGCGEENKSSNTNILIKNTNTPIVQKYDGDSSRKHIFCLEHAVEAEKQLRPFGGVDMLVLCHPEYPKIESEAKSLAEELGINYLWNEIDFRNATISDERVIRSALNDEEAIPSSRDWAVKLGINLSSSSSLGFSPLYAKQMPHNSIIHKAFGNNSPTNSPTQSKAIVKGKKGVVAGKWCGKIWMSNQVHPYLSHRDTQEKQPKRVSVRSNDAQEHSRNFNSRKKDAQEDDARNINAPPVSTLKQEIIQYTRRKTEKPVLQEKNSLIGKKRKETFREDTAKRSKSLPEEDSSSESISSPPRVRTRRSVQTNHETTKLHGKILKTTRKCDSNLKPESEGGPSTRLRRRPPKPDVDNKVKPKGEKRTKKKKAKTPATLDVATGGDETKEEEADYQCNVDGCNMGFGTKQELMLHKRNICSVKGCGKKFFSHKYLVQHKRVHIDDRPLKCPWKGCKMAFKWAWARTEHIRVHTGVRPYLCRVPGCGQTFRFVSDFSRHKRKTGHLVKGKK
ncbi:hypothetical protein GIB67_018855 [Kingdonia uniflora]|uniref:Lysine-specific demethylase REF6 n=1 Tax=Kingdonia uniflora TaxID=39325 RepID=A0A7J7NDW1_9MAGN|nr:hypothetical protein GIB67_018855 [Kingdonia uniflora]